jgi:hypothetical protein
MSKRFAIVFILLAPGCTTTADQSSAIIPSSANSPAIAEDDQNFSTGGAVHIVSRSSVLTPRTPTYRSPTGEEVNPFMLPHFVEE